MAEAKGGRRKREKGKEMIIKETKKREEEKEKT